MRFLFISLTLSHDGMTIDTCHRVISTKQLLNEAAFEPDDLSERGSTSTCILSLLIHPVVT